MAKRAKKLSPQQRGAITRKTRKMLRESPPRPELQKLLSDVLAAREKGLADAMQKPNPLYMVIKDKVWREVKPPEYPQSPDNPFPPPPETKPQGGVKHDSNKLRYDLIPPELLEYAAMSYTYGAAKYADRNWESGFTWGRIYRALIGHLNAWWTGERNDAEGMPHLANAQACLGMLIAFEARQQYGTQGGVDDRGSHNARDLRQNLQAQLGRAIDMIGHEAVPTPRTPPRHD